MAERLQVGLYLDKKTVDRIDKIVESSVAFKSRNHFIEVAIESEMEKYDNR